MNPEKKLRKENNMKDKQLTKENNQLLTDMIVYLHSGNLCEYDIEIIRKELLGMALEAQARRESFRAMVGEDCKAFCNELMKNGRQQTKYEKFLEAFHIFVFGVGALILLEIAVRMMPIWVQAGMNGITVDMPITLGFVLSTACSVVAAYGIFYFISKNSFDIEQKRYKILFGCAFAVCFTAIVLFKVLLDKIILCSVNFLYPVLIIVLLAILVSLFETRNANYLAKTHH